jgi:CubicO group peptidase (beta-lactamase class C family)
MSNDLRQYLRDLMTERRIPGLQVGVVRDSQVLLLDSLGVANIEHQVPVTQSSVFSINSMSKAFTGIAVMQLVEEGRVDLSSPISDYLEGLPDAWHSITVHQLATLSSGVPEIMHYIPEGSAVLFGDGSDEDAWRLTYSKPLEYPIGKGYAYTQVNYALLGRIIDKVAGKPFEQFIAERQFNVAGMPNTIYANDSDLITGRANTYFSISYEGHPVERRESEIGSGVLNSHINWPRMVRTAAGLHSTAADLANWSIALRSGKLLNPTSVETMQTPVPLFDGRPGIWGVGWLVGQSSAGRIPAPAGGAKAQIAFYPDGLTVILLTNLIGGFAEHLAPVSGEAIDLSFIDPIAAFYQA